MKLSNLISMPRLVFFSLISLILSGCSTIPPVDDGFVSTIIESKINSQAEWYQGCDANDYIKQFIHSRLQGELNVNDAIQIALWNNPQIQSIFEELGIARAALVEASLLSNPRFEVEVRYPKRGGFTTNIEYLITSSLLDLILIPLRTKLAATEFEQVKLKVADKILNIAFDVRQTYYELMIENQNLHIYKSLVELVNISTLIASRQMNVGNIDNLRSLEVQAKLLDAQLKLQQTQIETIRLKEKLNCLLGLSTELCLTICSDLKQESNYQCFNLESLEAIACKERLDLKVAYLELERLSRMLGLKEWWNYTNLQGGLAGERDTDGLNTLGPGFGGELPIFNYGQAARLSLYSQLRQAQKDLDVLQLQILSQVREAHNVLAQYALLMDTYNNNLFPLQKELLSSFEALYNVGGLGIDKLLTSKEQEILIKQKYLETFKHYLIARVNLDRALGGYLACLYTNFEENTSLCK